MWYLIQVPLAFLIVIFEVVLKWATSLNKYITVKRRKSLDSYIEAENLYVDEKYSEANKYKFASRHRSLNRLLFIILGIGFALFLIFIARNGLEQYQLRGESLGWW